MGDSSKIHGRFFEDLVAHSVRLISNFSIPTIALPHGLSLQISEYHVDPRSELAYDACKMATAISESGIPAGPVRDAVADSTLTVYTHWVAQSRAYCFPMVLEYPFYLERITGQLQDLGIFWRYYELTLDGDSTALDDRVPLRDVIESKPHLRNAATVHITMRPG